MTKTNVSATEVGEDISGWEVKLHANWHQIEPVSKTTSPPRC